MQLDLTQKLTSVTTGEVLKDADSEVTLGLVCCNALLVADAKTTKADDKVRKFKLAGQLSGVDSADVTAEDIVLLKSCINEAYQQPLIVGQAFALLEACGSVPEPVKDAEPHFDIDS